MILNFERFHELLSSAFPKHTYNTFEYYCKLKVHANVECYFSDSIISGFIAFYSNDRDNRVGFVSMIVVDRAFRGCGIGSKLLKLACQKMKDKGMKYCKLEVGVENETAIQFYTENGFYEAGKEDGNCSLYMIKKLG